MLTINDSINTKLNPIYKIDPREKKHFYDYGFGEVNTMVGGIRLTVIRAHWRDEFHKYPYSQNGSVRVNTYK